MDLLQRKERKGGAQLGAGERKSGYQKKVRKAKTGRACSIRLGDRLPTPKAGCSQHSTLAAIHRHPVTLEYSLAAKTLVGEEEAATLGTAAPAPGAPKPPLPGRPP